MHLDRSLSEHATNLCCPYRPPDSLPFRPDATIGDFGCGPDSFTLPLAEPMPQGLIHAIDVEPVMLDAVAERAAAAGLTNIRTLLATERGIPLPPSSLDGMFLMLVSHELPSATTTS